MLKKLSQFAFLTCLAATSCASPEADFFEEYRNADGSLEYVNEEAADEFDWTEGETIEDGLPPDEYRVQLPDLKVEGFLITGPILDRTFTCEDTGEAAELTYFFASNPPNGTTGAGHRRFAANCGEKYLVVQYDNPTPERIFGPFTKKNNAQ